MSDRTEIGRICMCVLVTFVYKTNHELRSIVSDRTEIGRICMCVCVTFVYKTNMN